jgi:hypothetical protein
VENVGARVTVVLPVTRFSEGQRRWQQRREEKWKQNVFKYMAAYHI